MAIIRIVLGLVIAIMLAAPAAAAANSPVASKDGTTFTNEDLSLFWIRNLGADALGEFLRSMIVYQEGLKQGLGPTQADINDYIETDMTREMYNDFVQLYSEAAVKRMIEYTLTIESYEDWLRAETLRRNNITVTESEARDYFLANISRYHVPDGVQISLITVANRSQAEEVIRRLKGGENFNKLAAEVNMDAELRALSGEIGIIRAGEDWLPKPIEDAAFALNPGEFSDILQGDFFHVIYCHDKMPGFSPTFDELKEDVMLEIKEVKLQPYLRDALNELMDREWERFSISANLFKPE